MTGIAGLNEDAVQTSLARKARPIHFCDSMIRAILSGRMKQFVLPAAIADVTAAPFGPGDELYVREAVFRSGSALYFYRADHPKSAVERGVADSPCFESVRWLSPARMPRSAARLFLNIQDVALTRLMDIEPDDAAQMGFVRITKDGERIKYGLADRDGLPGGEGWHWADFRMSPVDALCDWWRRSHFDKAFPAASNPRVFRFSFGARLSYPEHEDELT